MFFNQKPVPASYSKEKYELACMENIPLAFLNFCKGHPQEKMVYWKDASGEYGNSFSNQEVLNHADYIASELGESPKVAMMCKNLAILYPLELAIWFNRGHTVAIYDTDEVESAILKINLSKSDFFACDNIAFEKIKNNTDFGTLKKVLLLEPCEVPDSFPLEVVKLWSTENISAPRKSLDDWVEEVRSIKGTDLAKIIFSSGTTGNPKLIPLSHQNFLATLKGWIKVMHFTTDQRTPAYLPNAHVFQTTVSMLSLIGVGKTYITAKADLGVDLKKIKPNLFVAVPLVLDVFKDKIVDKLKGLPLLKNFDFSDFKNNNIIKRFILRWVFGRLVAVKLGLSECQWLVSGGAALGDATWDFFNDCLGIPIKQGYGMSETAAGISCNGPKIKKGSVGLLIEGVETKIDDDQILHVKGNNVTSFGYDFKNDHLDADGFFCTGDRARIDEENFVYLSGRKSDRVKMANGKFYNLETVAGRICGQFSNFPFSVPVLEGKRSGTLIVTLSENSKSFNSSDCENILEELDKIKDLPSFDKIVVFPEISVENGLLTPTQKVRFSVVIDLWSKIEAGSKKDNTKFLVLESLES